MLVFFSTLCTCIVKFHWVVLQIAVSILLVIYVEETSVERTNHQLLADPGANKLEPADGEDRATNPKVCITALNMENSEDGIRF